MDTQLRMRYHLSHLWPFLPDAAILASLVGIDHVASSVDLWAKAACGVVGFVYVSSRLFFYILGMRKRLDGQLEFDLKSAKPPPRKTE
jgi:hypothetical protein